jgi:hypothetical protein
VSRQNGEANVRFGCCVTSAVVTRNFTADEGKTFEVGNQVVVSSHRKLLSSKAMVVSVAEKSGQEFGQAWLSERKRTAAEVSKSD